VTRHFLRGLGLLRSVTCIEFIYIGILIMSCILFGTGCPSSSTTSNTLNETINSTVVNVLNQNQNTVQSSTVVEESLDVNNIEVISGCILNISQTANVKIRTLQSITESTSANLVASIMNDIKNHVESTASTTSGFGAGGAKSATVTNVINSLKNEMTANLTANNINSIIQNVNATLKNKTSKIKYDSCGYSLIQQTPSLANTPFGMGILACQQRSIDTNKVCNISQTAAVDIAAEQITQSVMGIIGKNEAVQKLINEEKSTSNTVSTGIFQDFFGGISGVFDSIFGGIFGGLGGYAGMVLLCCCCCCCCILLLVIVGGFAASSAGGMQNNNGGGGVEGYYGGGGGELR
jgi:hypothetical protein